MYPLPDAAANRKMIQVFKISNSAPIITHLCFTDEFHAKESNCNEVTCILKTYKESSDQLVNLEKFELWFLKNTSHPAKNMVQQSLKINRVLNDGNYLGLLLFFSRSRRSDFQNIVDNIQTKVLNWNNQYLSQIGKEIMLKSVAQALPTYSISCFHLPKSLIHEINMVMVFYWWEDKGSKKKIH